MEILLFIIVVVVIGVAFQSKSDNKRRETQQATILRYQVQFGLDFSNRLEINSFLFGVNEEQKKLLIVPPTTIQLKPNASVKDEKALALASKWASTYSVNCLDFKDIIGVEIKSDEVTVTKAGLGMPLAGGLLFGGAGAITGSILGKKTTSNNSKISLLLQLNNFENSIIEIPITKKDDPQIVRNNNISQLDKLGVWLKLILQENEQTQGQAENNSTGSNLDELEKLASLKDKGIITEEEFNLKKKQLLGI